MALKTENMLSLMNNRILKLVYLFSIIIFLSSCYRPTSTQSMQDLKQLEGNWKSYKGVGFNENWMHESENIFRGIGFSLNENDTSFYEQLSIKLDNDTIYYSVILESGKVTDFKLTKAKKDKWTFINPNNDYPSIINYEIENDTLLNISISNIRGNKEQFFWLRKVK